MQLFSADATIFSKKFQQKIFAPENMKNPPSKVAHNRPKSCCFQYWPGYPSGLKTEIPYNQMHLNAGLGILDWGGVRVMTYALRKERYITVLLCFSGVA
jgi:hypothetical protein